MNTIANQDKNEDKTKPVFRAALKGINAFVPARSTESMRREFGVTHILKLAGNENSVGASPKVKEAIKNALENLGEYPDPAWSLLSEQLAVKLKVDTAQIVVENGLFALLPLIAQVFLSKEDEVIIPTPSFGWYEIVVKNAEGSPIFAPLNAHSVDLAQVLSAVRSKTRLVILCNPNNPTGTIFNHEALIFFMDALPSHVAVVLDEAYCDFVDDENYPNAIPLLDKYANLIILRTFSKAYGLAGLRVGYGLMSVEIAREINKIRAPVNVNALAQIAAQAALLDEDFYKETLARNKIGRQMYDDFFAKNGIPFVKSHANFVLFNVGVDARLVIQDYLQVGILLRGGNDFAMPNWVRATIGTPDENARVLARLNEAIAKAKERC